MSPEVRDTSFERWALLGAIALGLVGFAAFSARHDSPTTESNGDMPDQDADLLRVRIGGEQPDRPREPEPGDDPGGRVAPDPPPTPRPGPPEPPDAPRTPNATRTVTVQPGETLGQIVQRELGTVARMDEVIRLNGIDDADDIRAGTELLFPAE